MVKIGNFYRWIYGCIIGKPTNFNWLIEGKLAGGGIPMSLREIEWFSGEDSNIGDRKIDYFHVSVKDYDAPSSLEELDHVVITLSDK
jgi:atypical dual specificity phosphatase